tara:strand:- start:2111 stop:3178 length:1068 start_codon:yes stop_codon:yes gene_type:complete
MSFIGDFIGSTIGSITGAKQAGQAAERAAQTQAGTSELGIAEQRRQFDIGVGLTEKSVAEQRKAFDQLVSLMSPYAQVGVPAIGGFGTYQAAGLGAVPTLEKFAAVGAPALEQQQAIAGLLGPERQRQAIANIEQGAGYQAQAQAGEEAILQRASATGGLRGGNVQAALGQFRPALLQQAIEEQYGRLGGLSALGGAAAQNLATSGQGATEFLSRLGQAAAAGQAAGGTSSATNISNLLTGQAASGERSATNIANLLGQQGAAIAGGQVAAGNVNRQAFGDVLGIAKVAASFSDKRLKKNIKKIGTRNDGLNVYEFEYIWGGGRQIGLMAQEVQDIYPDAISESGGYLMVNYSKV